MFKYEYALQNRTSKQIHTRQCSDCNGKYPVNEIIQLNINTQIFAFHCSPLNNVKIPKGMTSTATIKSVIASDAKK
jgi:hypothetical protein